MRPVRYGSHMPKPPTTRTTARGLAVTAGIAILSALLAWFAPFTGFLESRLVDARFLVRGRRASTAPVCLVVIDEEALARYDDHWPWRRNLYAEAVDRLSADGAAAIGLDFVMDSPRGADEDRELAGAIARSGVVVLPLELVYRVRGGVTTVSAALPIEAFREAASAVGFNEVQVDADGTVRGFDVRRSTDAGTWYHYAVELYARGVGASPASVLGLLPPFVPVGDYARVGFIGPRGTFPRYSIADVLDGAVPEGAFRGRVVIVGAANHWASNLLPTPWSGAMDGCEVEANFIEAMHSASFVRRPPAWLEIALLAAASALGAVGLRSVRPSLAAPIAFGGAAAWSVASFALFSAAGVQVATASPILAIGFCWAGTMAERLAVRESERRKLRSLFSRYVAPRVADRLLAGDGKVSLGGETRDVVVFFSDIRGFTTLSERMDPQDVVAKLNEYLSAMVDVVLGHDGTVIRFIGDAILAVWGAPLPVPDAEERAVRAALGMRERLAALNATWESRGVEALGIGMGIHRGEVVVGNIGSERQMDYTVIGDAVNVASRVEGLTRETGDDILVSEDVFGRVSGLFEARRLPPMAMKGKSGPITVYAVDALRPEAALPRPADEAPAS